MAIAHLAGTRNLELNTGRMPGTDAGNFAQTTVALARETGDAPARDDTFMAMACGRTNGVNHLVLTENIRDLHLLFEEVNYKVYFLLGGPTVHLDLLDVSLLLPDFHLTDLRVANGPDDLAVLLRPGDLGGHGGVGALARI